MADQNEYLRASNFTDYQALTPSAPLQGTSMDAELNRIKVALDSTQNSLDLIQRDDGQMANESVGRDQLKNDVQLGFNTPATWVTATNYTTLDAVFINDKFYKCLVSHISGVFADDLTSVYWEMVADFTAAAASATASAAAAATSETNAGNSEAKAEKWAEEVEDTEVETGKYSALHHAAKAVANAAATAADKIATNADADATASGLAGVQALYDQFDDRYLGSKASNPALDNDGNALVDGALYFNTTSNNLMVYDLGTTTWIVIGTYTHPNHTGDVTSVGGGAQTIAARAVTYAKMQAMATARLLGRATAGSGDVEELTAAQVAALVDIHATAVWEAGANSDPSAIAPDDLAAAIAALGGSVDTIERKVLSSVATAEFTGFDASIYDSYFFKFGNVIPASDGVQFRCRTSTNGGVGYDSGASDYDWALNKIRTSSTAFSNATSTADSSIRLSANSVGSAAGEHGVSGTLEVSSPDLAKNTFMEYLMSNKDFSGILHGAVGISERLSAADVDAVQFFFDTDDIESGVITMYGRRKA